MPARSDRPWRVAQATRVIRVLIADDQELVRDGFRMILDAQDDIEVVGVAADGRAAVTQAARLRPDVVLMDIVMPHGGGIEATRALQAAAEPRPRVLVLTTYGEDEQVYAALTAGASGFLLKDAPRSRLLAAVRTVAAGEEMLDTTITHRLVARFSRPADEARPARVAHPPRGRGAWPRWLAARRTRRSRRGWPSARRP